MTWVPGTGDADDYDLFLSPKEGVMSDPTPRGITQTEYKFTGNLRVLQTPAFLRYLQVYILLLLNLAIDCNWTLYSDRKIS